MGQLITQSAGIMVQAEVIRIAIEAATGMQVISSGTFSVDRIIHLLPVLPKAIPVLLPAALHPVPPAERAPMPAQESFSQPINLYISIGCCNTSNTPSHCSERGITVKTSL